FGNSWWCKECKVQEFKEDFSNWTSGNEEIDNFIKETQLNAQGANEYLKWIPFSAFINLSKSDNCEAVKVALIHIGDSAKSFLNELKIHYYGRTRNGLFMRLFGVTFDDDPGQRPTLSNLVKHFSDWHLMGKDKEQFINAEKVRIKNVQNAKLDPNLDPCNIQTPRKVSKNYDDCSSQSSTKNLDLILILDKSKNVPKLQTIKI
ncbi:4645_t:CDS:2, partial [Gigaspora margarita]